MRREGDTSPPGQKDVARHAPGAPPLQETVSMGSLLHYLVSGPA
jgi:hypothetical protein